MERHPHPQSTAAAPANGPAAQLQDRLERSGLRATPQRLHVYQVLRQQQDHPTAEEVFIRAKAGMPDISMATVYNCLDALVQCGLVRLVTLDRAATRYCSNMQQHHHFYCDQCGGAYDIDQPVHQAAPRVPVPKGFRAETYELVIHGLCPACSRKPTQA